MIGVTALARFKDRKNVHLTPTKIIHGSNIWYKFCENPLRIVGMRALTKCVTDTHRDRRLAFLCPHRGVAAGDDNKE